MIIDELTKKIRDEESSWNILLKQRPRPSWRIALGIVSIAGGIAMVGYGSVVASVHGKSVYEEDFTRVYDTKAKATGLIVPGSLIIVGGGMLIAFPNKISSDSGFRSWSAPAGIVMDADQPLIRY